MSAWWLFGRPYFLDPNSVGRLYSGHDSGLMVDGDEMCLWVGESGGRINLDSVLAD